MKYLIVLLSIVLVFVLFIAWDISSKSLHNLQIEAHDVGTGFRLDANGNNRVDRDEVLAVIDLYLFNEPINEGGSVTTPGADDPIEVSGQGTDVRRIELSEGLWTLEASVTENESCIGDSCYDSVFFVDIESVAGGYVFSYQ